MTVAKRMYVLIVITAVGLLSQTVLSYIQMNRIHDSAEFINTNSIPNAQLLDQALSQFEKLNGLIWQPLTMQKCRRLKLK